MPANCRVSLPSTKRPQRGVAVIMAMLTVALVAAIAASVVASFGFAVESLSGRHDLAQARWLARGAVDWARNVLADDARTTSDVDHLGETWAVKVPPTPVDEGEVSGDIEDLSGRFNLNNLAWNGAADEDAIKQFAKLLELSGETPQDAKAKSIILARWLDVDLEDASAYPPGADGAPAPQPLNQALVSVDELAGVPGFNAAMLERLRPFVTALPTQQGRTLINVNTASAEVLSATIDNVSLDRARAMVSSRSTAWFKNIEDFNARQNLTLDPSRFACKSIYFLAAGRAHFGGATTRMQVLLARGANPNNGNWPEIIWQKIL
ncbi:type II secretion system minor pseudopilin GspK [Niveibacterium sp. 24ML]|uniref:type II secretion system minor pseudopilin GspK n=1 Tax=Niveibacterium sp. 24ML TaxID=2985512 RepID=UPI00226D50C6|nr:type II secretion system minor pseudopilin GspK [Niveibacterium sp. 24ML]MCX9157592.1 type II secretion system minor pseudopilin GspK [Niveibacterium sp. 24ML]